MSEKIDFDTEEKILLAIARLIWKEGITINDLYGVLGVDTESERCDSSAAIMKLSGILTGWHHSPEEPHH